MTERTCVVCAERLTGRQTKYCGRRCAGRASDSQRRSKPDFAEKRRRYQRAWLESVGLTSASRSPTKQCPHCGKFGVGYQWTYCSRECAAVATGREAKPLRVGTCPECGESFSGNNKFCSPACHQVAVRRRWSPLRTAWESEDWPGVIAAMLDRTTPSGECREWSGRAKAGSNGGAAYGQVMIAKRTFQAHRVVATAVFGELGHKPVHHKCGNSLCISPDHLQVVEPHENTAEMLERHAYRKRIAELEMALASVNPMHPALRRPA